jgi:cytoskeletal protein RodZ
VSDPASRLRQAREEKGLSQRQVAEATKLSVRAIELLERDRLADLPDGIYRRSIVRSVAREVGLDGEQILREFAQRHPAVLPSPAAAVFVEPRPTSSFQRALAFVSGVLPITAGIVYFALPMGRTAIAGATHEPAPVPRPAVQRRLEPIRAEILPVGGFSETPAAQPAPVVVTLTISSRCQLRIVADGDEVLGRTMEPGETVPIELGEEILLLGDNASAVQLSINGQAGRQLGAPGDVLSARIGRDDYEDFLVRYND